MTTTTRASLGLALGGAIWGLYWMPLRWMAEAGAQGLWPGIILVAGATLLTLILALKRNALSRPVLYAGLVTGCAFALYSAALLMTDVLRAILLFYLTPVWGTILGWLFLSERISATRILALTVALAGLSVILGSGVVFDGALPNLGDWLALGSGLAWAIGSLMFFRIGPSDTLAQSASFLMGTLLLSIALLVVLPPVPAPAPHLLAATVPAILFVLPMIVLTVWPIKHLAPGRVGLLLMTEVVVGLITAAVFADETFGAREAVGAGLIVTAAVIEVVGNSGGQPARG